MKYILLLGTLFTIQGCSLIPPTKADMEVKVSEGKKYNEIYFKSLSGSFGYWCDKFSKLSPEKEHVTFSTVKYNFPYGKNLQGANFYEPNGTKFDIHAPSTLYKLTSISSLSVDWKGREIFMPKYDFSFNNNIVKDFVENCKSSFKTSKQAYLNEIEAEQQTKQKAKEEYKNKIKQLVTEKLQQRNFKKTTNGGLLVLSNALVENKLSDPASYFNFLESKNTAYYMDFSSYIVTQQINNSTYMLKHLIDVYGYAGQAQIFPIIFHSKKQLFEQTEIKPAIVIYKGVQTYKNIYGQNKQAVVITEL